MQNIKIVVYNYIMNHGIVQLFGIIYGEVKNENEEQGLLFGGGENADKLLLQWSELDITIITGRHSSEGLEFSLLPDYISRFFELSANAFDAIVHAWMSELPIAEKIIGYGRKITAAADFFAAKGSAGELAQRRAVEKAAGNWADTDVQIVQSASYKVWHEINRLMGLLRFCPDEDGVYIAHCQPDHFILPALGPHFRERFGDTPWAIIDEKRNLLLLCLQGERPVLKGGNAGINYQMPETAAAGEWEQLWKLYHKTINNESRNNPGLQKKLMPARYWKNLPEK